MRFLIQGWTSACPGWTEFSKGKLFSFSNYKLFFVFFKTGGYTADVDYDMSEIVVFEPKNSNNITWNKTGRLKIHSSFAGCSVIDQNTIQEILPFCKP